MKNRIALLCAVIILSITTLQLISQIFLQLGNANPQKSFWNYRLSIKFYPLDFLPYYKAGLLMLREAYKTKNNSLILKSIENFKKALFLNPFHVNSHYFLAKAYILYKFPSSPYFDEAVREFKIAAQLGFKRKTIVLDTSKLLLSMWPLLSEEDRRFCRELLRYSVKRLTWNEFQPILEMWWLYSKDMDLLLSVLREKSQFYRSAADYLVELRASLKARWQIMEELEKFIFSWVKQEYSRALVGKYGKELSSRLQTYLKLLDSIKFYSTLLNEKEANPSFQQYRLLKSQILLQLSEYMLSKGEDPYPYLMQFVKLNDSLSEINKLQRLLKKYRYFRSEDLKKLYLEDLVLYKLKNYSSIIEKLENFKKSVVFVKKENLKDYLNLLLLLEDSYLENKLLMLALNLADEIRKLAPEDPRIYLRYYRIFQYTGFENAPQEVKDMLQKLLNNSTVEINLRKASWRKELFLLKDAEEITLSLDEQTLEKIKDFKLIQIFIDGQIAGEFYPHQLSNPLKIKFDFKSGEHLLEVSLM